MHGVILLLEQMEVYICRDEVLKSTSIVFVGAGLFAVRLRFNAPCFSVLLILHMYRRVFVLARTYLCFVL